MLKHPHLNLLHSLQTKKNRLFISTALGRFALGMGSIFIPVFLYEIGWSVTSIAIFFIVTHSLRFMAYWPIIQLIGKIGAQKALRLSYILFGLQMASLFFLESFEPGIVVTTISGALATILYWTAIHLDIVDLVDSKKMNRNVGVFVLLGVLAEAGAPVVGGVVGATFGPAWIFFISLAALTVGYFLIETKADPTRRIGKIAISRPDSITMRSTIANFSESYTNTIGLSMWFLYIFILLGGIDRLGYIVGFGLFISSGLVMLTAKYGDRSDRFFLLGYAWRLISYPLRFLSTTQTTIIATNTANSAIANSLYGVSYASHYHKNAKKTDTYNFIFWVEIMRELAIILAWVTLLILLQSFNETDALRYSLVAAGLAVPFVWLMRNKYK